MRVVSIITVLGELLCLSTAAADLGSGEGPVRSRESGVEGGFARRGRTQSSGDYRLSSSQPAVQLCPGGNSVPPPHGTLHASRDRSGAHLCQLSPRTPAQAG